MKTLFTALQTNSAAVNGFPNGVGNEHFHQLGGDGTLHPDWRDGTLPSRLVVD